MKQLIYQDIKEYYFIDESGNIFSNYKNNLRLLKADLDKDGYKRISLQCANNKRRSFRVNRLVAVTFISNPHNLPIVDHIDNNKINNNVSNLQWLSCRDNTIKGRIQNDYSFKKKLSVLKYGKIVNTFNSVKECAEYYGITYYDISKIANNKIEPYKTGKIGGLDFKFIVEKCID